MSVLRLDVVRQEESYINGIRRGCFIRLDTWLGSQFLCTTIDEHCLIPDRVCQKCVRNGGTSQKGLNSYVLYV
jgi:hypothetical protein